MLGPRHQDLEDAVPTFQLLQWRGALQMEAVGLRAKGGRSVRAHVCRKLGLKLRTPYADVQTRLGQILHEREAAPDPERQTHFLRPKINGEFR